jgi:hypothetical protein
MVKNGRQAALVAMTWAMLSGWPAAQAGLPKDTQLNPGSVKPGGGKPLVIGCLSSEGDATAPTFVLSDSRAKPPAIYHLTGDVDLLRMHLGHTIEVGGPITSTNDTRGTGTAPPTLKVESLAYVAKTCLKYQ